MNSSVVLSQEMPDERQLLFQKVSFKNLVFEDVLLLRAVVVDDANPWAGAVLTSTDDAS
jgi:hypothetical protein